MNRRFSSGGVLLMMMLILGMFMVITISTAAFINRQFKETVNEEQEERSFHLAEAGVHYALFLLNSAVYTPAEMVDASPIVHVVTEERGEVDFEIGTFTLIPVLIEGAGQGVVLVSEGRDASLNRCQTILTTIERSGVNYQMTRWDHSVPCGGY